MDDFIDKINTEIANIKALSDVFSDLRIDQISEESIHTIGRLIRDSASKLEEYFKTFSER